MIDYAAFFEGLRHVGYQGHVAYEMCAVLEGGGSLENLDRTARRFLEFLKGEDARRLLAQYGFSQPR